MTCALQNMNLFPVEELLLQDPERSPSTGSCEDTAAPTAPHLEMHCVVPGQVLDNCPETTVHTWCPMGSCTATSHSFHCRAACGPPSSTLFPTEILYPVTDILCSPPSTIGAWQTHLPLSTSGVQLSWIPRINEVLQHLSSGAWLSYLANDLRIPPCCRK